MTDSIWSETATDSIDSGGQPESKCFYSPPILMCGTEYPEFTAFDGYVGATDTCDLFFGLSMNRLGN